ncbi:hypothetical protein BVY02_01710, partial [bacterium J17]
LQVSRDNLHIQYCLAGCYYRQDKFSLAQGVLEHILQRDPTHEEALELRKIIEEKTSGESPSLPVGETAESSNGDNGGFGKLKINKFKLSSELPSAESTKSAPSEASLSPERRLAALEHAKEQQKYEELAEGAAEMLADPSVPGFQKLHASVLRAEALVCLGEMEEATELFISASDDLHVGYRAVNGLGVIAAVREQWTDARTFFHNALEKKTDNDVAIAGLGLCAMQEGDHETAWGNYQRALEINCENKRALLGVIQLGYSLNRLPDIEKAISDYLELHPVDLQILYAFAGCLYAQGKTAEAKDQLNNIKIFEPTNEMADELLKKIEDEEKGKQCAANV